MPLETLEQFTRDISDLPDKPNVGMDSAQLKDWFDAPANELRDKYNALVNVLKSSQAGDSGAENIGATSISGVTGNTVQSQMSNIFTQLQQVVLGQLPNKSITREKFADGAVDFSPVQKEIANLNLQLSASQLVPSGKTYGWSPTTSFGVIVDFTRGKTTVQLNAGDTSLDGKVTMSEGTFTAGKRVTVLGRNPADNSIVKEEATITGVSPLTISPLVNSYKAGAWLKRTTANNTASGLKFGGVDDSVLNTVTDETVINSAYDTSGNGGRKIVASNNDIVMVVKNGTTEIRLYKRPDGGTPVLLANFAVTTLADVCIENAGNGYVGILYSHSGSTVSYRTVSVALGTLGTAVNVDSGQSAVGNVTMIANETRTEMSMAVSTKNPTYANSWNIRSSTKGTINADGSVTWGTVSYVRTSPLNTSGVDERNPTIVLDKNGLPVVICDLQNSTSNYTIYAYKFNGTSWSAYVVYSPNANYAQSSPSAIFVPQSVNGLANGRIWVAWHGYASGYTTYFSAFYTFSDDGGVTWNSVIPIFYGSSNNHKNLYISANKSNEIFFAFEKDANIEVWKKPPSTVLTNVLTVTSGSNPSVLSDHTINFTSPLFIYKDSAKVGFYGTWTIGSTAPILENTLRFTLTQQAKEVMTYLHHTAGLTATAQVNGTAMDKATTTEESQFTKVLGSLQDIEIEVTLSRASVEDDITIDKILGGVA